MPTLTQAQIAQVARAGGLPGDPDMWAAIAMAESSGNPEIINPIGCVGLWQINQPAHIKSHPQWTVKWLQNPVNNAKAAAVIFHQQGMDAWEAYTGPDGHGSDGPWKQYYKKGSSSGGVTPVFDFNDPLNLWPDAWGDAPGSPGGDTLNRDFGGDGSTEQSLDPGLGNIAEAIGTIAEAVQKSAGWLGNARNWARVGYVAGGGALVLLGLSIVAKPLLNATPMGRMAKAAGGAVGSAAKKAGGAVKSKRKADSSDE